MKIPAIIDDFSRGEVSPLTLAKLASLEVRNGLDTLINMDPDPRGPLIGRQGTIHRYTIPATAPYCTLIEWELYEGKTLVLIFYDNKLDIYNLTAGAITTHVGVTTPYTDALLHGASHDRYNLEAEISPDNTTMRLVHSSVTPYLLTIADLATPSETTFTVTLAAITFTDKPAEWTGTNFPSCCTFMQDRCWYSGCEKNPVTFWGSKSGAANYNTMTLGTLADDAVKFSLQWYGLIKWLAGHQNLLIGSSSGEFVASAADGAIEPGDVDVDPQSAHGSKRLQPEFIGDEVLYVSSDGRKLRSMWWRWVESGWKSIDLTFMAEHLTAAGIKDINYARDPSSQIWAITAADKIISCMYRRTNEDTSAIGWSRFELGNGIGKPVALCCPKVNGRSVTVVAAQVTVNGATKLHLMSQDTKDIYTDTLVMLDNYTRVVPTTATITGLTQYEGQAVDIVADGAVLPRQTVTSGSITLDAVYGEVFIGRSYRQKFVTLPYIVYEKQLAHPMKRWNKIWLMLHNSFPPLINGKRPATRYPDTPMGQGDPPISGLVMVTNSGWDREAKITIEQDIPKPLAVLGIYGEVNLETV
jgi:hypothetical protein